MTTPQGLRDLADALYCRALWRIFVHAGLITPPAPSPRRGFSMPRRHR